MSESIEFSPVPDQPENIIIARDKAARALHCDDTEKRIAEFGLLPFAVKYTSKGRSPYYLASELNAKVEELEKSKRRDSDLIAEIEAAQRREEREKKVAELKAKQAAIAEELAALEVAQ